ncbi:MAG: DUF1573 domain-containing protein [Opitutae bacterium]|nr:DUF1573 domain-containing protein [Opitutae bacterium]
MLRPRLLACLFAALAANALALDWQSTTIEARAAPFQTTVEIAFTFKNTGARPVALRDIQSNCDCLTATSDKPVYQPGETGRIDATFTVGDRFGLYERSISIVTDDAPTPIRLHVRIEVPEPAAITPRTRDWPIGAALTEELIVITVAEDLWIDFTEATSSNGSFSTRLEPVEHGRRYRLFLRPASTATAANAAIRIKGQDLAGRAVLLSAYANVR